MAAGAKNESPGLAPVPRLRWAIEKIRSSGNHGMLDASREKELGNTLEWPGKTGPAIFFGSSVEVQGHAHVS
jgi:hypothetical protein